MLINEKCPYGGYCIDPGNPSDCQLNGCSFVSFEEKEHFDALPDKYELKLGYMTIKFKNENQVKFLLADYPIWKQADIKAIN